MRQPGQVFDQQAAAERRGHRGRHAIHTRQCAQARGKRIQLLRATAAGRLRAVKLADRPRPCSGNRIARSMDALRIPLCASTPDAISSRQLTATCTPTRLCRRRNSGDSRGRFAAPRETKGRGRYESQHESRRPESANSSRPGNRAGRPAHTAAGARKLRRKARPAAAPSIASRKFSVINCRTTRARLAPIARRISISRCRARPRASSMFPRLAHAESSTSRTITMKIAIAGEPLRCCEASIPAPGVPECARLRRDGPEVAPSCQFAGERR